MGGLRKGIISGNITNQSNSPLDQLSKSHPPYHMTPSSHLTSSLTSLPLHQTADLPLSLFKKPNPLLILGLVLNLYSKTNSSLVGLDRSIQETSPLVDSQANLGRPSKQTGQTGSNSYKLKTDRVIRVEIQKPIPEPASTSRPTGIRVNSF